MKNYQKTIFLGVLIVIGFVFYAKNTNEVQEGFKNVLKEANLLTVCDDTLYYSLGSFDPKFNLSQEEALVTIKEAEAVWESELGKNVFEYREGAEFKFNFIFDERQLRTTEKSSLEEQLDTLEYNKNNLSQEYQNKYNLYKSASDKYEKNLNNYSDRVDEFNDEVKKLEKNDEMTKEKYEELKNEEEELAEIKKDLDDERERVNKLADEVNKVVNKESALVDKYNSKIETYRDKFGESTEFNQGEYDGRSINIYQFHNKNDLTLVLAHELGHALEIEHVENSKSIMYYLMENQDLENIKLTTEDLSAIKTICKLK